MEFNSEKLESSVRRGSLSPYSVPMSLKLKLIRTFKSMDSRNLFLHVPFGVSLIIDWGCLQDSGKRSGFVVIIRLWPIS